MTYYTDPRLTTSAHIHTHETLPYCLSYPCSAGSLLALLLSVHTLSMPLAIVQSSLSNSARELSCTLRCEASLKLRSPSVADSSLRRALSAGNYEISECVILTALSYGTSNVLGVDSRYEMCSVHCRRLPKTSCFYELLVWVHIRASLFFG